MSEEVLQEAVIRYGDEKYAVVYLTDVLWYDLWLQKIPGTSRQKFHHLFKFHAGVALIIRLSTNNRSVTRKICIFSPLTREKGINIIEISKVEKQTIIKSCGIGRNQLCKGLLEFWEKGDLCQFWWRSILPRDSSPSRLNVWNRCLLRIVFIAFVASIYTWESHF